VSKLLFRIKTLAKEPYNNATAVQTMMMTLNGMLPSGNGIVTTHDSVTKEVTRGEGEKGVGLESGKYVAMAGGMSIPRLASVGWKDRERNLLSQGR
jgi:hypothetical protein